MLTPFPILQKGFISAAHALCYHLYSSGNVQASSKQILALFRSEFLLLLRLKVLSNEKGSEPKVVFRLSSL
jgi:hypothetical protein